VKVSIPNVCGGGGCLSETSRAFQRKLVKTAWAIGTEPAHLAAVIAFETGGSFEAGQLNQWCEQTHGYRPDKCGTGLIQFMPSTTRVMAQRTGANIDNERLASMSNVDQLDWVRYYFKGLHKRTYRSLSDLYRTVFWPQAVGKPSSWVATRSPASTYEQNRGLDRGGKGYITAADIDAQVTHILAAAAKRAPVVVDTAPNWLFPALLGAAAGAALGYASIRHRNELRRFRQKLTVPQMPL
jgi:hypothetical protein